MSFNTYFFGRCTCPGNPKSKNRNQPTPDPSREGSQEDESTPGSTTSQPCRRAPSLK
jgi:hypothetical protein